MDRDDQIEDLQAQLLAMKAASASAALELAKSQANAAEMERQLQEQLTDLKKASQEVAEMRERAMRFEVQANEQKSLLNETKVSLERSLDAQATLAGALAHCASGEGSMVHGAGPGFRLVASASVLRELLDNPLLVLRDDPSRTRSSMAAALLASHIDRGRAALETMKHVAMKLDSSDDDAAAAQAATVELGGCLHAAVRAMAATLPNMTPGQIAIAATPSPAATASSAEDKAVDWRNECLVTRASREDLLVCLGRTQAALLRVQPRTGVHSLRSSTMADASEAASHSSSRMHANAADDTEDNTPQRHANEPVQALTSLFGFQF